MPGSGAYAIGFDLGSSSVKAALVDLSTKKVEQTTSFPATEMAVISAQSGWAEQDPELWWQYVCQASNNLLSEAGVDKSSIKSIGLSYQMHGLVMIDKELQSLRPAIIWSDSRAVDIGSRAFEDLGEAYCLQHLLNAPGNFTMSKLKWVQDNEPEVFNKIYKFLLPGDFIALRMTGNANTTISGLSEAIIWDFEEDKLAVPVLDYFGFDQSIVPDIVPTIGGQGKLTATAANQLGLQPGIMIGYRAGDQPNNAMSLNVLEPGEVAATGGTSGVVYAIEDKPVYDPKSRVNGFAHVNHTRDQNRIGILLCLNGAGSQYSWLKHEVAQEGMTYPEMENMAGTVPIGAEGLRILPFGNGAERIFENKDLGAHMINLEFNQHSQAHVFRAALEGIAFSFVYGLDILREMGIHISVLKVGNDNLFQSAVFSQTIASLTGCEIDVLETTGAVGAALASGVGIGEFSSIEEAMTEPNIVKQYHPEKDSNEYERAYSLWKSDLIKLL